MNISFESPYYNFILTEKIKSKDAYHKLLNWLKGDFDLYQIDELEGLKVYYPNGWFTIMNLSQSDEIVNMEISVKCKSKNCGLEIVRKIKSTYNHLVAIYKCELLVESNSTEQ